MTRRIYTLATLNWLPTRARCIDCGRYFAPDHNTRFYWMRHEADIFLFLYCISCGADKILTDIRPKLLRKKRPKLLEDIHRNASNFNWENES